ncbi:MAG: PhzF family phenazine biosynthesis protein [Candidatus Thorarchaeota archaeon]
MAHRRSEIGVFQVDAFTDIPFGGNPALVVFSTDLNDDQMMKIVDEIGPGQTVFIGKSASANWLFRYMTRGGEMPFSGHLTVAGFVALIDQGLIDTSRDVSVHSLETRAGVLQIEVVHDRVTGLHEVQITHERPTFMKTYDPHEYAMALGLSLADIMSPFPIQTVSTGVPQLMVPVSSLRALRRIQPNPELLNQLQSDSDWLSIQVFTRETLDPTSDVHVRHFAPLLGIEEDPVTGSAAGSMAGYLIKYGIIAPSQPVTSIVIEQGHILGRPGKIFVEVDGDQNEIRHVKVSGKGVTVMRGTLLI